jgi:hypothetical protein
VKPIPFLQQQDVKSPPPSQSSQGIGNPKAKQLIKRPFFGVLSIISCCLQRHRIYHGTVAIGRSIRFTPLLPKGGNPQHFFQIEKKVLEAVGKIKNYQTYFMKLIVHFVHFYPFFRFAKKLFNDIDLNNTTDTVHTDKRSSEHDWR